MDSICGENLKTNQEMVYYSHDIHATIVLMGIEISKKPWGVGSSTDEKLEHSASMGDGSNGTERVKWSVA